VKRFSVLLLLLFMLGSVLLTSAQDSVELTIATVNNPDMIVMESFTEEFQAQYPNINLNWVILPENELRATVTTDVATGSSTFDIVTVGMFEVPLWAGNGWLNSIDALATEYPDHVQADYDFDDLLPGVKLGLSFAGELYSLPFYGDLRMTCHRLWVVQVLEGNRGALHQRVSMLTCAWRSLSCVYIKVDRTQWAISKGCEILVTIQELG